MIRKAIYIVIVLPLWLLLNIVASLSICFDWLNDEVAWRIWMGLSPFRKWAGYE